MPAAKSSEFTALVKLARDAYLKGQLERAISKMREAYEYQVNSQLENQRFHKGYALHQLGLWTLEARKPAEAFQYFLKAFVEDSLSEAVEKPPSQLGELGAPAAAMLVYNYNVGGSQLVDLARRLREAVENRLFQTPDEALEVCPLIDPPLSDVEREAALRASGGREPFAPPWRLLGEFGTPLENRVFVGGSYAHPYLEPALAAIRDTARQCGWDGVLVAEFKNPLGLNNRTKSLICLMGCRRAIFDLSESGGHQVEFDKLVDFGLRDVLVVYNAEANDSLRISTLTQAWFGDLGVTPRGYQGISELQSMVRDWLPCEAADDGRGSDTQREALELARTVGDGLASVLADRLTEFATKVSRSGGKGSQDQ